MTTAKQQTKAFLLSHQEPPVPAPAGVGEGPRNLHEIYPTAPKPVPVSAYPTAPKPVPVSARRLASSDTKTYETAQQADASLVLFSNHRAKCRPPPQAISSGPTQAARPFTLRSRTRGTAAPLCRAPSLPSLPPTEDLARPRTEP